jgi:hypothetical protein
LGVREPTVDENFRTVLEIVGRWSAAGETHLANGTHLICPTPHVAPEAWLHVVFPDLSSDDIGTLSLGPNRSEVPGEFQQFLHCANGLLLFSYQLSVWGIRQSNVRAGDEAWQPHDLSQHNTNGMRPDGSPDTILYFAGDEGGASWCFFEPVGKGRNRVGVTPRNQFQPTNYWSDFWTWLLDRVQCLSFLYDAAGNPIPYSGDTGNPKLM